MPDRVYIETTFVSYLTARPSRDVVFAGHQQITHEWWDTRRTNFELCVSQLVVDEAGAGDQTADHLHARRTFGGQFMNDPIVDEVRRVREAHASRFNFDLDAIFRDIKEKEKNSGRTFASFPPRKAEPKLDPPLLCPSTVNDPLQADL
jgi:hypothetical protein